MNKHIDALEVQAWEIVDNTWDWTKPDNPSKATLFKTIFAELIVKECANVLTARAMFYDGFGDLQIRAQTMETAADLVKYHFGVTQN
jgi:hypothetical protein